MTRPAPRSVDDEGLPRPRPLRGKAAHRLIRTLVYGENAMFIAIAAARDRRGGVRPRSTRPRPGTHSKEPFAVTITRAVNAVLFIVIVLELLRTIVARLDGGGVQLQPFLVIGIISASRHILTAGAELSLSGQELPLARTMIELGVNAAVVLALPVALVLVRRFAGMRERV